ncbi:MAG TPA: hypothetical protein VGR14_07075 [Verrucomicrobiae bacterium]|jgi:hypothetical protein|nr:hypothetical protein [Verrucomicrobiae bacterium]
MNGPRQKAFLKAGLWTLLTSFFGLLQLWIVMVLSALILRSSFSLSDAVYQAMREGVVLFLVSAIVVTITIDYYFDKELQFPKWLTGVLFSAVPVIAMVVIAAAYSAVRLADSQSINENAAIRWQIWAFGVTFLYAVEVKYLTYLKHSVK